METVKTVLAIVGIFACAGGAWFLWQTWRNYMLDRRATEIHQTWFKESGQ